MQCTFKDDGSECAGCAPPACSLSIASCGARGALRCHPSMPDIFRPNAQKPSINLDFRRRALAAIWMLFWVAACAAMTSSGVIRRLRPIRLLFQPKCWIALNRLTQPRRRSFVSDEGHTFGTIALFGGKAHPPKDLSTGSAAPHGVSSGRWAVAERRVQRFLYCYRGRASCTGRDAQKTGTFFDIRSIGCAQFRARSLSRF